MKLPNLDFSNEKFLNNLSSTAGSALSVMDAFPQKTNNDFMASKYSSNLSKQQMSNDLTSKISNLGFNPKLMAATGGASALIGALGKVSSGIRKANTDEFGRSKSGVGALAANMLDPLALIKNPIKGFKNLKNKDLSVKDKLLSFTPLSFVADNKIAQKNKNLFDRSNSLKAAQSLNTSYIYNFKNGGKLIPKNQGGASLDKPKANYWNPLNWGVSDYSDKGSFGNAYSHAKKEGDNRFIWNGKRYSTEDSGEVDYSQISEREYPMTLDSRKWIRDWYTHPETLKRMGRDKKMLNESLNRAMNAKYYNVNSAFKKALSKDNLGGLWVNNPSTYNKFMEDYFINDFPDIANQLTQGKPYREFYDYAPSSLGETKYLDKRTGEILNLDELFNHRYGEKEIWEKLLDDGYDINNQIYFKHFENPNYPLISTPVDKDIKAGAEFLEEHDAAAINYEKFNSPKLANMLYRVLNPAKSSTDSIPHNLNLPDKNIILSRVPKSDKRVNIHELAHSLYYSPYTADLVNTKPHPAFQQIEDIYKEYGTELPSHGSVSEIPAYVVEARYLLGLKPGEPLTDEHRDLLRGKSNFKGERLEILNNDTYWEIFKRITNTIAENNSGSKSPYDNGQINMARKGSKLVARKKGGELISKQGCGCSIKDDGIDTDIFKSFPSEVMKTVQKFIGTVEDGIYKDSDKNKMKSNAKSKNKRLVDYLSEEPTIKIAIIKRQGGGSINIKPENRGKFTEYCKGKVTKECIERAKSSGNSKLVKRAVFAENARKWNH